MSLSNQGDSRERFEEFDLREVAATLGDMGQPPNAKFRPGLGWFLLARQLKTSWAAKNVTG